MLGVCHDVDAQVFTRTLGQNEMIEQHIHWYFADMPDAIIVPPVDVKAVLKQDSLDGKRLERFGIRQDLNLMTGDGMFYTFGNYSVWKIVIRSPGAKSLNFMFSDLMLPHGSKMYIYGMYNRMIHGPIEDKNVRNKQIGSDMIYDEIGVIDVLLPHNAIEQFRIAIGHVIHGIHRQGVQPRGFGDALQCHVNVACPEGIGWENEISAVCLIYDVQLGREICTGTVINNECSDFTPFVLTADHCLNEPNIETQWIFRFNYESISCPVISEPNTSLWISFFGAQHRSSWFASDFALVELFDPIPNATGITFAGWDRSNDIPNSSTFIHHPAGDVKKITHDAHPSLLELEPVLGLPLLPGNSFRILLTIDENGDFGAGELGSSGAGQFNQDRRMVGQLSGGFPISCEGEVNIWFGRIFSSWNGGGTANTRLRDWLGGVINPVTTNTSIVPFVSGNNVVCITPENYTLLNPVPAYNVQWEVQPDFLFNAPTSGINVNASLSAINSLVFGAAELTYTLTHPQCGELTFSTDLWVGKPRIIDLNIPECFVPRSNILIGVDALGATHYSWTFPTCPNGTPSGDPDPQCWFNYTGNGPDNQVFIYVGEQTGYITVYAMNNCGTVSLSKQIQFCEGVPPGPGPIVRSPNPDDKDYVVTSKGIDFLIYPNPAIDIVYIDLHASIDVAEINRIQVYNSDGQLKWDGKFETDKMKLDARSFSPGVYILRMHVNRDIIVKRFIIL